MLGRNQIREVIQEDTGVFQIKSIVASFKGDEPYCGAPAIFVNFGGCNLACNFCDTDFEDFIDMKNDEIIQKINGLSLNNQGKRVRNLVVLTGGEPLRQPISHLCNLIVDQGFAVLIETNGTIFRNISPKCEILISPKNTGSGYSFIRDDLLRRAIAIKFVISKSHPLYQKVPDIGQSRYNTKVYLQPMDEFDIIKNLNNLQYILEIAEETGYYYNIQTQKIIGLS
ncbi:MAG: hypothetical protein BGO27_04655 [Alphaproteobacteria bacterium 33-17]|nr:MAG: hypothetical protein BGO27_04655 [Alphaproteobacteria bacterium 33-17]